MAFEKLTDYERKRLENIRLNDEKMASLKLQSIKAQVSASTKRPRVEIKSYKVSPKKQPKTQTPIVMRRSLRTRGLPPDANGLSDEALESMAKTMNSSSPSKGLPCYIGPLSMKDAYRGVSDRALIEAILDISKKPQLDASVKGEVKGENGRFEGGKVESSCFSIRKEVNEVKIGVKMEPLSKGIGGFTRGFVKKHGNEMWSSLKLESLTLKPENVARVVPGRIMNVKFFPCTSSNMIAVGNKFGNIGFWHIDSKEDEESGIYLYRPHNCPISGILIQQHSMSKIFTSCYDGYIRLMDAEKEVFDLVYSSEDTIYSMSQQSKDPNCLYFAEGHGGLSVWDQRTGNLSNQWSLHEDRINSVDFSSANPNLMATSSTDGTACIWDLRRIVADKTLQTISHNRAVHSAYFSPSGSFLATTSIDDTVGISSGVNFENTSMIYHNNKTSRWISKFRAIWGWDDAYVFIGNVKRGVDVISPVERRTVLTLESPHMTAIPCRFDAHPYNVGMLAGSTAGGQVYVWTLG
ncbi:WD repeat-containing protein 76-like [Pyrus ussuriensis x Pyrus communis]|uniref:WD repeat-containing protein 76 n=1 Tax=Pyrus ussuriensis x Pyrus communis TaxID=2448454 RepID=A0A5N5GT90_9ROSA|nr:WD repeat-containing protein 76-like [Pyrus ussuriensis x Pyrus communis]